MAVKAPVADTDDPEREQECLVALAGNFKHLAATAAQAGWTKEEIAFGLLELSRHEVRNLMKLGQPASDLEEAPEGSR